jgi:hypothetical protein
VGEEEAGEAARGDDGPVALGTALRGVEVEEVETAGLAQFFDLAEELEHGHGGIGCPAGAEVVAVGVDQGGPVLGGDAQGARLG